MSTTDSHTSPIPGLMQRMAQVPLDELRAYVQEQPQQFDSCGTCGKRIRSTPSVHADGSVHWASGGWEHVETEQSGCEWKLHPFRSAAPSLGGEHDQVNEP